MGPVSAKGFGAWIAGAALAVALAFVFAGQARDDGFRAGHRGWVSAHTLAIAAKATPENGHVGYAVSLATPASRDLYYFDRYPVFFAAGLGAAQRLLAPDKVAAIRVARQAMNVVYALTLVVAVLLLAQLGLRPEAAVAAAALAGAGYGMVEYRDMVHFDQPALLGIVVLLWSLARWYAGGSTRVVLLATAFAVASGRGYASYSVLGLWWILEAARLFLEKEKGTARRVLFGAPTQACLLGIVLGVGFLGYNVVQEARARRIPVAEVGIVRSAVERLSLDRRFNEVNEKRLTWGRFLTSQGSNLGRSVLPWTRREPLRRHREARAVVGLVVLLAAVAFAATRTGPQRPAWLLACLAGPLWILAMRNLAAFHPYTAIYLFPVLLTFFAAMLHRLPRRLATAAALGACWLLVVANEGMNHEIVRLGRGLREETRDMEGVARALLPGDAVAVEGPLFRGVPLALGFYLPGHDIVVEGPARLVISRNEHFTGENLTPVNSRVFLFEAPEGYRARSSLARYHPDSIAADRKARSRERKSGRR
ncbi:MAG: hypothetical protein ABR538_06895 [Candidatus Binatia bacterium]